jgi:hypothetical protein
MNQRVLPLLLRICAGILTIVAIVIFFIELRDMRGGIVASLPRLLATPVITIAMALALAGLADLLAHASDTSPEVHAELQSHQLGAGRCPEARG